MALQRGKLADIQYVSDSSGSIYANPAASKSYIRSIILHNTNSAPETVELYNVPDESGSSGTAANSNRFFKKELAADETLFVDLDYPLVLTDENDSIQAISTSADMITVQVLGDKDV